MDHITVRLRNVVTTPNDVDISLPLETLDGHEVTRTANTLSRKDGKKINCWGPDSGVLTVYIDPTRRDLGWGNSAAFVRNVAAPSVDLTRTLTTADGKPVKLLAQASDGTIVIEVTYPNSKVGKVETRYADGRIYKRIGQTSGDDLVNPPLIASTFHNVYADGSTGKTAHKSFDAAKNFSKVGKARIAILEIKTTNGVFDTSVFTKGAPYTRATSKDIVGTL